MNNEIIVKKPRVIKFFGIAASYERYSNKQQTWIKSLPKNGDKIKLTWLPSCRNVPKGTPNPYIGMEGIVENMNIYGDFVLKCEGCSLICNSSDFRYIII